MLDEHVLVGIYIFLNYEPLEIIVLFKFQLQRNCISGVTVHLADRWSIKKSKLLKQHNPNKCVHKKEKGNKSGQLETIKCLKFIHMRNRMNAGNGKLLRGLLFMASLIYGLLPIDL